jgi:lambda family phage portal protein
MTQRRTRFMRKADRRVAASTNYSSVAEQEAYKASSVTHQDLATWTPTNYSAQAALSYERELMTSRVHDIARNDGWASAAIDKQVDNVVGGGWRLSSKPDAESLEIEPEAANELADQIEAAWNDYTQDIGLYCDVSRKMTEGQIDALAFRHRMLDGEALGVLYWLPDRGGAFATSMMVIDPDRLSQPDGMPETETLRAGVEMDSYGVPTAYHIRKTHPGDWALANNYKFNQWQRVRRENSWGRPIVVHAFESHRAGQVRGIPPLSPVLRKLKQLTRYDEAELQAATLNAILAAFITSPMDHEALADSIMGGELDPYQEARLNYWKAAPLRVQGAQVSFLYPGEKAELTTPQHPNSVFEQFERTALRNIATAVGITYEQLTGDYSQVNYSSARAALLEVWRGLTARKNVFAAQWKQPWFAAWLEEAIERKIVELPAGAPSFEEKRAAYCHAEWIGPGRGWVDPQKEADAAATRIDAGFSTLERECSEQGLDWREVIIQRKREREFLKEMGMDPDAQLRATMSRGPGAPPFGKDKDEAGKGADADEEQKQKVPAQ